MKTIVVLAQDIISTITEIKTGVDLKMKLHLHEAAVRCDAYNLMQVLRKYGE